MTPRSLTRRAAAMLLAAGALTAPPAAAQEDWDTAVAKACEHRRYGMRLAIAKRIAQAGDAPVPALQSYAETRGRDVLPLELVSAIAGAHSRGAAVIGLLESWARDRAFYWRAQALGGLAHRRIATLLPLFREALTDPSHLYRIEGTRGLYLLDRGAGGTAAVALLQGDPDPRVRVRIAAFLAEQGDDRGHPTLVAALSLDDDFLGDPWGRREAKRALEAAIAASDDPVTLDLTAPAPARAAAVDAVRAALRRGRDDWVEPELGEAEAGAYDGGVGVRSCRNGDLFLRWSSSGVIAVGLEGRTRVTLPSAVWAPLRDRLAALGGGDSAVLGRVVCDYLEIAGGAGQRRLKCAPGAAPAAIEAWLRDLAAAIRGSSGPALAEDLLGRLGQFSSQQDKQRP